MNKLFDWNEFWYSVVSRTAKQGIEKAKTNLGSYFLKGVLGCFGLSYDPQHYLRKWLCVWALGAFGEYWEWKNEQLKFISDCHDESKVANRSKELEEFGDWMWEVCAARQLILNFISGKKPAIDSRIDFSDENAFEDLLHVGNELVKKILRDNQRIHFDEQRITDLAVAVLTICQYIETGHQPMYLVSAANAVDAKLRKRYPFGYAAQRSISRVE